MMISGRNNRSATAYVFTASQWEELEQQLLTFKYLMSGIPVPPELISTLITTYHPFASSSPSSRLFPNQHTLPFGWGCYKVGYGRKIDPEPGRCRRTDGKKWRCTKEACPDSKYCERHIHRGKNKSKKQPLPNSTPLDTTTTTTTTSVILKPPPSPPPPPPPPPPPHPQTTTNYPHYCKSQKLHSSSFLSPNHNHIHNNDQPSSYSLDFTESTHHNTAPHWLSHPLPYRHPNKDIRYTNEMKGTSIGEGILGPLDDIGYNNINKDVKKERFGFDTTTSSSKVDDEITQKQFFHHFLGD